MERAHGRGVESNEMIDRITGELITTEDLRREIALIQRQIEAARTEEVEIVFRELLAKRERALREIEAE